MLLKSRVVSTCVDRKFKVRVRNEELQEFIQENGIPLGCVISMIIFTVLVNDPSQEIQDKQTELSQCTDD